MNNEQHGLMDIIIEYVTYNLDRFTDERQAREACADIVRVLSWQGLIAENEASLVYEVYDSVMELPE